MSSISFPQQKNTVNRSYPDWLAELDMYNNGADGAFNPSSNTEMESSIYRFSSFNIPSGVTVTPKDNYLIILVDGPAMINGLLSASGKGGGGGAKSQYFGNPSDPGKSGAGAGAGGGAGGTSDNNFTNNRLITQGGAGGGAGGPGEYNSYLNRSIGGPAGNGARGGDGYDIQSKNGKNTNLLLVHKLGLSFMRDYKAGGGGGSIGAAGGAGAGGILLIAKSITGNGEILSKGIKGEDAVASGTAIYGGGGGGGGGLIITVTNDIPNLLISATGGGAGAGTSSNELQQGGKGGEGLVIKIRR